MRILRRAFSRKMLIRGWLPLFIFLGALSGTFVYSCIDELDYSPIKNRSHVLYARDGTVLGYSLSKDSDSYRFYTRTEEVSPLYLKMLLASEDRNFYEHPGVDFLSLLRAFSGNVVAGRITSGGSTIAMQVVKRLTGHKRTYLNKLKEVVQAIYITGKFGRNQVLEWYLTLAPFSSNIEGVKAASLRWFNHLPDKMTPAEAALLTALPRAPEHIRPDRNYKAAVYYINDVLKSARRRGVLNDDLWKATLEDDIPVRLHQINQEARTLATFLFQRHEDPEIYTWIEPAVQRILHNEAVNFHEIHQDGAVLSAVVMDAATHRIVGILGSSDLRVTQICLPFSRRSPGSALKPFAYGLAFQDRRLHPGTILHDNSRIYGSWKPANFTNLFTGKVTAAQALTQSLNLPAIEVLGLTGPQYFVNTVNRGEKRLFLRDNTADYSVVLGSGSISLVDLANLYAMLNEDGMMEHYALLRDEDPESAYRILSADSARAVFNILKTARRPANGLQMTEVSYKTGTSSRFADALALGSMDNYTAGVAIRFPENRPGYYQYSGFQDAAPILFGVFSALKAQGSVRLVRADIESELLREAVPEALREIVEDNKIIDRKTLKIDFPGEGDIILPDGNGYVFIRHSGGTGKVYFTVNSEQREENYFRPDHEGYYSVSILDEAGRSDRVTFRVVLSPEEQSD